MSVLVPLTVAVPLLTAGAIAALGSVLGPRVEDVIGIVAALATTGLCTALVVDSASAPIHYFFGGWQPRHGVALGVAFSVDPLAAALAGLAAALTTASLVFSWRYFDEVATLFHVLMLVFLAGMVGFALSADLFNMFVFFELMGVCAFTLTGYRIDQPGPLQGALNFAVTNSIAAFLILTGIGLLYGRTGALNLAQIGESLAHSRSRDGLVVVAFALLLSGFLIKAGAVPFHFWLSDAYAVAPIPVCVLLSGAMSDLGIHGIARIYWTVFSGPFGDVAGSVRGVLVAVGLVTALVGALMSFLEADLKRLLAFVTISHAGVFLTGTALLTPRGLSGTTIYVVADGLVKGGLFLALGMVVFRLRAGDELTLRGRGRALPYAGSAFLLGAVGLAAPPPFGGFLGRAQIDDSALGLGWGWLPPLLMVATAVAAGAALRAGGRVFLGLGPDRDPLLTRQRQREEEEEPVRPRGRSPFVMLAPAFALLAVGFGLAFAPGLAGRATQAAARFETRSDYAAEVLHGKRPPPLHDAPGFHPSTDAWLYGAGSIAGAVAVAGFGLYRRRLPGVVRASAARVATPPLSGLKALHSGVVGDYVAWLTLGTAALGGLFALTLR